MSYFKDCLEIVTMICFLFFMYRKTYKPYIKEVKEDKPPKEKKRLKYFRRFHIPYRGKAKILEYDKQWGYIDSAWNEVQKPKKKSK